LKIFVIRFLFFFGFIQSLNAQVAWKKVETGYGSLPASVQVFKTTDSLNGRPFAAWYIIADLKDKKLEFTAHTGDGERYTPSKFFLRNDSPIVVVNSTFFSFTTNQSLNAVVKNGKLVAYNVSALKRKDTDSFYYPTRSAIGINRKRKADVAWLFTDTAMEYAYAFQRDPIVAGGKNPDPAFSDLNTMAKWNRWKMETAVGGGPV
jgi:hypothetical protein